jgi:ABC-type transport system substrate-binding protein
MSTWGSHHRASGSGEDHAETAADEAGGFPHAAADEAAAGLVRVCQRFVRQRRLANVAICGQSRGIRLWGYPDIDALYEQQAVEADRSERQAVLHQIQARIHEGMMFSPIWSTSGQAALSRGWRSSRSC